MAPVSTLGCIHDHHVVPLFVPPEMGAVVLLCQGPFFLWCVVELVPVEAIGLDITSVEYLQSLRQRRRHSFWGAMRDATDADRHAMDGVLAHARCGLTCWILRPPPDSEIVPKVQK